MQYRIFRRYGLDPVQYLAGGKLWTTTPGAARRYTLHGAQSLKGKLERQWIVEPRHPDVWGFQSVNEEQDHGNT